MANCVKCGEALEKDAQFCASCGTAVKSGSSSKGRSKKSGGKEAGDGAVSTMGKLALLIVRIACIVIVVFFFFPYYSINYYIDTFRVSGIAAALGIDQSIAVMGYSTKVPIPASPGLLLVPLIALAVLAVLHVPKVREKVESIKVPLGNVPVIGDMDNFSYVAIIAGLLGLIFLSARNAAGVAGIGLIFSVLAYIAILAMPFVDKYLLSKKVDSEKKNEE